nr:hypothetical protein CFP56_77209 [Quercus suber]
MNLLFCLSIGIGTRHNKISSGDGIKRIGIKPSNGESHRTISAKAHIPFPPLRNTSLSCFSTTRSIRTVQSFGSLCRTLRASFSSSSFDTIPIGSYSYVEIRLNLPWLSAVAQGSSRLAIEVNVEAHGLKDG